MKPEEFKLLKLAANACGITLDFNVVGDFPPYYINERGGHSSWNPLKDDGDAFRLQTFLGLNVFHTSGNCYAMESDGDEFESVVSYNDCSDKYEATRKAIVRAAAKIGDI